MVWEGRVIANGTDSSTRARLACALTPPTKLKRILSMNPGATSISTISFIEKLVTIERK